MAYSAPVNPLVVAAGPRALKVLEQGWDWSHFDVVLAASGGPKWLILSAMDRLLVTLLLRQRRDRPIHLLGSSSGAWRFCAYCQENPGEALERLQAAYIEADWNHHRPLDQRGQTAVSLLQAFALGVGPQVLRQPAFRLHVVTALCHGPLALDHPLPQYFGLLLAAILTWWRRTAMKWMVERALFSDPRDPLPSALEDVVSRVWPLGANNFDQALLASGAIPTVLPGVRQVADGPAGCLRDGGLVDYHFDHLCLEPPGLILYPHFASGLHASWLENFHRHSPVDARVLDRLVLIHPNPEWVARLPGAKVPDRNDALQLSPAERCWRWQEGAARGQELADCLERTVTSTRPVPLSALR